jgi:uncharacterized protein DUF3108
MRASGPRGRIGVAGLALLLALGGARSASAASALALHYDAYYLAFHVLSIETSTVVEPSTYRMDVAMQTDGLLGALFPWHAHSAAFGRVEGLTLLPSGYRVRSEMRDRQQRVELSYDAGKVRSEIEGSLIDGQRDDVPETLQSDTVDPVSASVAVAHEISQTGSCAGTRHIFDGIRRYDLRYEDLGASELEESSRDPYHGVARRCRATVEPIAGFLKSGEGAGESPTLLEAWLASPLAGADPVPVRLELSGPRGMIHIHLTSAVEHEVAGSESAPAPANRVSGATGGGDGHS